MDTSQTQRRVWFRPNNWHSQKDVTQEKMAPEPSAMDINLEKEQIESFHQVCLGLQKKAQDLANYSNFKNSQIVELSHQLGIKDAKINQLHLEIAQLHQIVHNLIQLNTDPKNQINNMSSKALRI